MPQIKRNGSACYCVNLRRAANSVSALYNDFLAPLGLSVNQYSLLKNLGRLETASVSDLANFVGLERTTLVRTLKPLIDRGLIVDLSGSGRRSRDLRLTEAGQEAVAQGAPLWLDAQAEIERRIGPEGVADLCRILALLVGTPGARGCAEDE